MVSTSPKPASASSSLANCSPHAAPSPSPFSASETCRRSEEHTSELQSQSNLVCRLLLEKKKNKLTTHSTNPPSPRTSHRPTKPTAPSITHTFIPHCSALHYLLPSISSLAQSNIHTMLSD